VERGQRIALIGAALIVAAVAFILLQPDDSDDDTEPAPTQATLQGEPTASVPAPKPKPEFEIVRVAGGQARGGAKEITVEKGDTVRLEVRSADTAGEVHVHGYELAKDVEPGGSVRFQFKASIEGLFEIELEETHTQIAELTVEP
jgi:heme/copper-type cytochrome/quinol oxidase subunit 2